MKIIPFLLFIQLFLPLSAHAAGAVSLRDVLDLALERNHSIRGAGYDRDAARSGLAASRSRYFPSIRLDEAFSASNSPTRVFMMKLDQGRFSSDDFRIDNLNHPKSWPDFNTSLTLEQPIFDLGIGYNMELAKREEEGRGFAVERRREDVGLSVFAAYLDVRLARARLTAAGQAVSDAKEHLRLARARSEAGVGLKSDELRGRTFLSEMEQQHISAADDLNIARMRLSLVTGGSAAQPLDAAESYTPLPPPKGGNELMRLALKNRPGLKEAQNSVGEADARLGMAKSAFFPTVYASAAYQMNDRDRPFGRDNDAWVAGANLRWELFDGMRRWNRKGQAAALKSSAAEQLEAMRKDTEFQVSESLMRREEAAKRLDVARNSVADADESVRLISRRFENSLSTMVELLDAETALNRARLNLVESEAAFEMATARVYHAAGILLKEAMSIH